MTPRIPLPADSDLPSEIRETLANLDHNFFRMLANAPASFREVVDLAESILMRSELPPRKREVAVLRVAHITGCNYEWTHHIVAAKVSGVTDDEIGKIAVTGSVDGLGEEDDLLCRVADEITGDVRLSDDALAEILARYGVRQAMELILCCSFYNMVSRILQSTRVELEEWVKW